MTPRSPAILPLRTDRLVLRALHAPDATTIHGYRNDADVARYQDWTLPFTLAAAERLVADQAHIDGPVPGDWVQIGVEHAGELVGDLAVGLDRTGTSATIGYTLRRDAWGRGLATEAVGGLIDALFGHEVHRVAATIDPDNVGSARLLERLGFHYEGRAVGAAFVRGAWMDDDRYALLRDERTAWVSRDRSRPAEVRLVELTPDNLDRVAALATHHSQERFVAPMGATFGDALARDVVDGILVDPWYRVIVADERIVGFLMIAEETPPGDIPFLWRLLIDRMHQGRGIGTRAVTLLVERLRAAGKDRLHVSWFPGRGSPEPFYRRLGFLPDGRIIDGQVIAELRFGPPGP